MTDDPSESNQLFLGIPLMKRVCGILYLLKLSRKQNVYFLV